MFIVCWELCLFPHIPIYFVFTVAHPTDIIPNL